MAPKTKPLRPALVTPKVSGKHTGAAPRIRKLKISHPEMSEVQIAKVVGCDPSNVHRVLTRFRSKFTESDLGDFQESKAEVYDVLQLRALGSITDDQLANASVRDRAVAAGIWEDKARVIRGQATQINVSVLLDAVNLAKEMQAAKAREAMESVRARMSAERAGD